jgi:hypothetical protein
MLLLSSLPNLRQVYLQFDIRGLLVRKTQKILDGPHLPTPRAQPFLFLLTHFHNLLSVFSQAAEKGSSTSLRSTRLDSDVLPKYASARQ